MKGGLLLNVVISKRAAIFQLLRSNLLIRRDALLILDLSFDIVYSIRALDFQCDVPYTAADDHRHEAARSDDKTDPKTN